MWDMKCVAFAALSLAICAEGAVDGVIDYPIEFDNNIHKGILIITCDDWVHPAWLTLADSLDCPISFMCAGGDMTPPRQPAVRLAWETGADIGVHTQPTDPVVPMMTDQQLRTMFESNTEVVRMVLGNAIGGPIGEQVWAPQSWVYYGNNWSERALRIGREYFSWQRVRFDSSDSAGVITSAYPPLMASGSSAYVGLTLNNVSNSPFNGNCGRGVPILQAKSDRMPYQFPCRGCDDTTTDTTGLGMYLNDLARNHLIGVPNIHPGRDIDYFELMWLMYLAKNRGDIWITTPRKLMDNQILATALNRSLTDTLYISATADEMGLGTYADPAHIKIALNETWTHPIKCKSDEEYILNSLVSPSIDLVPAGALHLIGPSTIVIDLNNAGIPGDPRDVNTSYLKCSPRANTLDDDPNHVNTYPRGKEQKYSNLKFVTQGNTSWLSSPAAGIQILGKHVTFEQCQFESRSRFAIKVTVGGAHLTLRRNTFNVDTSGIGCGAVVVLHASDSSQVFVGNRFESSRSVDLNSILYWEISPSISKPDTIANNIFWNRGDVSETNAIRYISASQPTVPSYSVHFGGNLAGSVLGREFKIQFPSGQMNWVDGCEILDDLIEQRAPEYDDHNWFVTYDPVNSDTIRWGGIPLAPCHGTAENWASIGPEQSQVPPDPFILDIHFLPDQDCFLLTWPPRLAAHEYKVFSVGNPFDLSEEASTLVATVPSCSLQLPRTALPPACYFYVVPGH
jgi:hypothetical protein